jgi:serine/alanine adding enzyme
MREDGSRQTEWREYVERAAGAELYHDHRWRSLIEGLFGHRAYYLFAADGSGRFRGVLPLLRLKSRLFGDFLVSLPYVNYAGVLADSTAARDALLAEAARLAQELELAHVELRHRGEPSLEWPHRDDKVTMLLDLPGSGDALWKRFKPKLRAQIRRAEKAGAEAGHGGPELLDDFYAVFARNMRDLGTPVYPKRFFAAILETFPRETRIVVVRLSGRPVAAAFLLSHRDRLEIPWASSLREHNPAGVNMLLYWSVLEYAADASFRTFDFGRSSRDSGTYRFKAQWGAEPQPLRWHYWLPQGRELPRLNPSNPKYRAAISLWRRLPVPVANLLGPGIVKNLP